MRTKLTLRQPDGAAADIVVTTDVGATVGDVADAIARTQGLGGRHAEGGGPVTLRLQLPGGDEARSLRRGSGIAEAGLRPGSTVTLVPSSDRYAEPGPGRAEVAARLRVTGGPDTGLEVDLGEGASTVGRGSQVSVRLTDPMVSKLHARVVVGETVEIHDAGSSNGVLVGGGMVDRATLGPQDHVLLGESVVRVEAVRLVGAGHPTAATIAFNRSPRVVPRYAPRTVEAPTPPDPVASGRLPVVALLAPVVMGVALYSVTRSLLSLVFVALTPLLMAGTHLDRRVTDRKRLASQTSEFRDGLARLVSDLDAGIETERRLRLDEVPATAELVEAAIALGPLLWCRRPEDDDFLTLRVGLGSAASRTRVTLPPRGSAVAGLWAELEETRERYGTVAGVPVLIDLRTCGALGVAGPPDRLDGAARALVAQLVCLHSPAELCVAGLASARSRSRWGWLAWLPHVSSAHSPLAGSSHLASSPAAASALVVRLEEVVADRRALPGRGVVLPAVLLVVEDDTPVERGRLVRLAEEGPAVGVHVVWCAQEVRRLPAVCRAFLALDEEASRVGLVQDGTWTRVDSERVAGPVALDLARGLAGVVDVGAPVLDESDVPRAVSYLALAGRETASDPGSVLDHWRETGSVLDRSGSPRPPTRADASLRALVGQGTEREFVLDLRSQGPHALVGGTTGAGKSEFLQAWVLGMAAAHSPDRVTFLFVDYKGGAAFADCVQLPHCVGLVTDLSPHLVRRALTSLRAELRHRERLLNHAKAKDLLTLERTGDPRTPPALVLVVDEFAALVQEVPEFVDGVVDIAQRGRSLGLHLILATQRPAGVIKDNLRANTNLRVALRMADEHDSEDVLGSAVAAHFDPGVPGRGAVRTGPGRIAMFQTGYVGGRSAGAPVKPPIGIETLAFEPGEPWDVPAPPSGVPEADEGPTDVERVVTTIAAAARLAGIPAPRRPWLPELAPAYDLAALGPQSDEQLAIGVVDVPEQQQHHVLSYRPDDGALVVHGTGGSGKSTVLRTMAVAAGLGSGGPVHVYGLDLGAGGLAMLSGLPHVGAVIDGADTERVWRLLHRLRDELDARTARYSAARAGSIGEYRALSGNQDEPRVLLLLDGLSAFRDVYEAEVGRGQVMALLQRVVTEGRPVGLHVVMSAERPGAVPTSLAGAVQRRLVLRQASEDAYGVLDVPKDVLGPQSPPGRGVMAGGCHELQVAVVAGAGSPAAQAAEIDLMARRLHDQGIRPAPAVRRLPAFVELSTLPSAVGGTPVLGVADDTLEPIGFEPRGTFLLAGLPGSGRSTALGALSASLRRHAPNGRLYYIGNRRSPVQASGVWTGVALTPEDAADLAAALLADLREPPVGGPGISLVVEAIGDFIGGPAEHVLTEALKAARRNDHFVLAEAETSAWGSAWPLVAEVRNGRRGLVLQPDQLDGDTLFRTSFPRMTRAEFPPGRGVVVESGRLRRVQVPVPT